MSAAPDHLELSGPWMTPSLLLAASTTDRPSPRLMAMCSEPCEPRNRTAPRIPRAVAGDTRSPAALERANWFPDGAGYVTPTCADAHWTSPEQSNTSGPF